MPILEEYFEKLFVSKDRNSFTHIFAGKDEILNTAVFSLEDWGGLKGRFDIEQIREACSTEWIHEELPFFQMYRRFGEVAFNFCYSEKENDSQVRGVSVIEAISKSAIVSCMPSMKRARAPLKSLA